MLFYKSSQGNTHHMNTNQKIDYILDRYTRTEKPSTDELVEYREYLCDMTDVELQTEIDLFE